jgi:hypothetical protein
MHCDHRDENESSLYPLATFNARHEKKEEFEEESYL